MGTGWNVILQQLQCHLLLILSLLAAVICLEIGVLGACSEWIPAACFTLVMLPEGVLDGIYYKLYHKLSAALLTVGALTALFNGQLWHAMAGAFCFGGLLLVIFCVSRGGLGFGDICYAVGLGAFLGWEKALLAFCLAFMLGFLAAGGEYLRSIWRGQKAAEKIPLGPLLMLGSLLSLLWGQELIAWYVGKL